MKVSLLMKCLICCCLVFGGACNCVMNDADAFSSSNITRGSTGDDVIELQARLQWVGYYNGKIDGIFGWGTYWALRNFQNDFGLTVDGIAGKTTKSKLTDRSQYHQGYVKEQISLGANFTHYGGMSLDNQTDFGSKNKGTANNKGTATNKNTGNTSGNKQNTATQNSTTQNSTTQNIPSGYTENDIKLLANAVYGESRGEPYVGQVAVAAVILNRVDSPSFPNTVSEVIFEPLAFTAVADGQIWLTPNETARKAVIDAINGYDPSGEALYYFNPKTATSDWIWSRPQIKQIGNHIFCK